VPRELAARLDLIRRAEGATPFMAWLTLFEALLHRLSGQDDFLVGTPLAQRQTPEVQPLIGFFLNTVSLRVRADPAAGLRAWLRQTRETVAAAFAHGELPFDEIVRGLERTAASPPPLQVLFVLQEAAVAPQLPGVTAAPLTVDNGTAKFDLVLFLDELAEGGSRGMLEFSADLFDADTIERMAAQFLELAGALTGDPEAPVGAASLLPAAERRTVLKEFNRTRVDSMPAADVMEQFAAQARRTPDAVAVSFGETKLSYADLDQQARHLAAELRRLGVGPNARVGVCLERSPRMIVALLATLHAGGACLPLDPEYPVDRLRFMLEDARPTVLLTQSGLRQLPGCPCPTLMLDALVPVGDLVALGARMLPADRLVYVLFTSGSTGRPKGVAMPQHALSNLISWQARHSVCGAGDRTLQFASLSFDVSFQEIFATLCTGGTLVLVPEAVRRDLPALARCIREQRVARLFLPFVVLDELVRLLAEPGDGPLALREIITAGEALRITPAIADFFTRNTGVALINQYGPTETHVVTAFALAGPPSSWPVLPPIGRPIANSQVYVLDAGLQPMPVGVPGELCVGGVPVAQGYLGRPELTAERFVPDPFSAQPGARLYRTGDRCRWLKDGTLEFLGRRDDQVKVRGFRVELGEVESVLAGHPGVQQAAVVERRGAGGIAGLAAFVVARRGCPLAVQELRDHLLGRLPEYMVPGAFACLDQLPLTRNGKVDRRALASRSEAQ
jgi:amino acid adenylation domain-containing protein